MSDVAAVVFTIGEPYTERAIESVRRQTLVVADVVVIDASESPFHRAFNAGAARVRAEFFLQVDADLVLDADCAERLRACMRDELGVVTGRLRDPLLGRIGAVRLFRTCTFERISFPDSVSPDTDFGAALARAGWRRLDALGRRDGPRDLWHTFGEHRPDYTPLYTFAKFRLDGARCRYRRDPYTLRSLISRLRCSPHAAARLALVSLLHGVFHRNTRDQLCAFVADREFELAERLLSLVGPLGPVAPASGTDRQVFIHYLRRGAELGAHGDAAWFNATLDRLADDVDSNRASLVALLGLAHGLFQPVAESDPDADYALVADWLLDDGR